MLFLNVHGGTSGGLGDRRPDLWQHFTTRQNYLQMQRQKTMFQRNKAERQKMHCIFADKQVLKKKKRFHEVYSSDEFLFVVLQN